MYYIQILLFNNGQLPNLNDHPKIQILNVLSVVAIILIPLFDNVKSYNQYILSCNLNMHFATEF